MRETSYKLSKQNSQQPKDIRGGEKKVMKKSLSTILSLAMAFSMFSSVALGAEAAKTSADFSDLKDLDAATKAKFDDMISAGIFDGVSEGTFGLKDKMNRAQFAKVAALVFKLKVDTSLKTSSFADVKADDPANGYALPYIEAVKAAGITDGYAEGQYNPSGEVTKEQLATFLLRGLGLDKDAQATPGVTDKTVSDWAKGYVALAIQKKLLTSGTDGTFGGTSAATRDLLVLSSYEAKQQYKPNFNGKYAIASFKATDANILSLELNGALSEEAAKNLKLEIKKDGAVITSGFTTKWSDDKTKATLTFDAKFVDSKYEITLGGLTNIDETAKTASVTTSPEKITKIDFLTASDTIPLGWDRDEKLQDIRIDFKATNQYGAKASLNASAFDIKTNDGSITPIAGEQAFRLTQEKDVDTNDRISITIIHKETGVQANKLFTVGMESVVAKVEVGDLVDSTGKKIDAIDGKDGYGYLDVKAWDQYGFRVEKAVILNDSVNVVTTDRDLETGVRGNDDPFVSDVIGDDADDLRIWSDTDEDKDVTVQIFANGSGQSVSKQVKIRASKEPASVEFGSYNYQLAKGDDYTKLGEEEFRKQLYVPVIIKDANGDVLDADDVVTAYYDKKKFTVDSSNGITLRENAIQKTGPYKGYIAIKSVDKTGAQDIDIELEDKPVTKTWTTYVGDVRTIESVKFSTTPKKYQTPGITGNVDNELKLKFYDQYGQTIKYENSEDDDYYVNLNYRATEGTAVDQTYLQGKIGDTTETLKVTSVGESVYKNNVPVPNLFDTSLKFYTTTAAQASTFEFKAELFKKGKKDNEYKSISKESNTLEVLNPNSASNNFTYEVYADKSLNNTLLAAGDFFDLGGSTATQATYVKDNFPKLAKELKVRVKKNGEEVKTGSSIVSISSANNNIATAYDNKFVAGINPGTTKLTVLYANEKGERKTAPALEVTTKADAPTVTSLVSKKTEKSLTASEFDTLFVSGSSYMWDAKLGEKLTLKDNYGGEVVSENTAKSETVKHASVYGLTTYITDVVGGTLSDVVVAEDGKVSVKAGSGVTSFVINVMAGNGTTATFTVSK